MSRFLGLKIILLSIFLLLWACQSNKPLLKPTTIEATNPLKKGDDLIQFTILQINDVYEISPIKAGKFGGMARVATLYQQLKKENPNILFVHGGDFLNPSLYGTVRYEGKRVEGQQMVEVMNIAGVDLVVFGNHEFDLKEKSLQHKINISDFEWLATNLLQQQQDTLNTFSSKNPAYYYDPFHQEKNGVKRYLPETYKWTITDEDGTQIKVGIFGATINSNPKDYVFYEDFLPEVTKAYLDLSCESDMVLGLTHLRAREDIQVANTLPNIPLIMGGHDHYHMEIQVGNVKITKADANAETAWVHRFTYNQQTQSHTLDSELVPIDSTIAEDPATKKVEDFWEEVLLDKLKEVYPTPTKVIYYAKEPLDARDKSVNRQQTNMGQLICGGIAASAKEKAVVGLFNAGGIRIDDQLAGAIQAIDIFRVLPYKGNVTEMDISGADLAKVLAHGLLGKSRDYLQTYNVAYKEETKTWLIDNQPLNLQATYHIALNGYLLEILIEKELVPKQDVILGEDVRVAIINYMDQL